MIVARVMMVMVLKIMMIKKRHHDCSKGATSDILTDHHSEKPDPPEFENEMILGGYFLKFTLETFLEFVNFILADHHSEEPDPPELEN